MEDLTDFTLENSVTCLNTKFQKRKGKLWTYFYAYNAKAQVGYILMNKNWVRQCPHGRSSRMDTVTSQCARGFAGCRSFLPSPLVNAGYTRGLWFANAI